MATTIPLHIDHLVFGAPSLKTGVQFIEKLLGVTPVAGGQHPGLGTHNALLALGSDLYLEIIAPDPDQPEVSRPLWMGVDQLRAPRLIRWAVKNSDLNSLVRKAREADIRLGAIAGGSREKPDGTRLSWQLTMPSSQLDDMIFPFFIQWGNAHHPAQSLPSGGALIDFQVFHPQPNWVKSSLSALGLDVSVAEAEEPALAAVIQTSGGAVSIW